jgi:hypothetical protein
MCKAWTMWSPNYEHDRPAIALKGVEGALAEYYIAARGSVRDRSYLVCATNTPSQSSGGGVILN